MKTVSDINAIRDAMKAEVILRGEPKQDDIRVTIGMGAEGIAKGANDVFVALVDAISARGIAHVKVMREALPAGENAPIVVVKKPDAEAVTFGNVTASMANQILDDFILGNAALTEYRV